MERNPGRLSTSPALRKLSYPTLAATNKSQQILQQVAECTPTFENSVVSPSEIASNSAKSPEREMEEVGSKMSKEERLRAEEDERLRKYLLESSIRSVVEEMVRPLIKSQKDNQADVNRAMIEYRDMKELHLQQSLQLTSAVEQLLSLPGIVEMQKTLEDQLSAEKRTQKSINDSTVDKLDRNRERLTDVGKEMQRLMLELGIRDERIKRNTESMLNFKDRINTDITQFMRQITREIDTFTIKSNKSETLLVKMENFYKSSKGTIDGYQQELQKVAYQVEKQGEQLAEIATQGLSQMRGDIAKVAIESSQHVTGIEELNRQIRIINQQIKENAKRTEEVEHFIDSSLPMLINMQISSYFQEFLSVPDQLKLIEFDNKKLEEIQRYLRDPYDPNENPFENTSLSNVHPAKDDIKHGSTVSQASIRKEAISCFNQRIESLMHTLLKGKLGFGQFKYGRDWRKQLVSTKFDALDKAYSQQLNEKRAYLETQQTILRSTEEILRLHRLKILEKYGFSNFQLDDFTLRKPEELHDNPFMRFIGFQHPVKVVRDIAYIRETPKMRRKYGATYIQARRNHRRKKSVSSTSTFGDDDLFAQLIQTRSIIEKAKHIAKDGESKQIAGQIDLATIKDSNDEGASNYNIYSNEFTSEEEEAALEEEFLGLEQSQSVESKMPAQEKERAPVEASKQVQSIPALKAKFARKKAMTKVIDAREFTSALKKKIETAVDSNRTQGAAKIRKESDDSKQMFKADISINAQGSIATIIEYLVKKSKVQNKRMVQLIKFTKEQSLAQNQALTQALDKVKKQREQVEDQVDFLDQRYREVFSDFERKLKSHKKDIDDFQEMMKREYLDFFKNRQRIRSEIATAITGIHDKIDSIKADVKSCRNDIEGLKQPIPSLFECLSLLISAFKQDNKQREALHKSLRVKDVPNEGFSKLGGAQSRCSTGIGNARSPVKLGDFSHDSGKEKYMPDLFDGSLYLSKFQYRNQNLSFEHAITRMESLLESAPRDQLPMPMEEVFPFTQANFKTIISPSAAALSRSNCSSRNGLRIMSSAGTGRAAHSQFQVGRNSKDLMNIAPELSTPSLLTEKQPNLEDSSASLNPKLGMLSSKSRDSAGPGGNIKFTITRGAPTTAMAAGLATINGWGAGHSLRSIDKKKPSSRNHTSQGRSAYLTQMAVGTTKSSAQEFIEQKTQALQASSFGKPTFDIMIKDEMNRTIDEICKPISTDLQIRGTKPYSIQRERTESADYPYLTKDRSNPMKQSLTKTLPRRQGIQQLQKESKPNNMRGSDLSNYDFTQPESKITKSSSRAHTASISNTNGTEIRQTIQESKQEITNVDVVSIEAQLEQPKKRVLFSHNHSSSHQSAAQPKAQ